MHRIYKDLELAGLTHGKDLYFVGFSMGGVVLRHLIVNYDLHPAGVVFVASPLIGSNIEK